jgi:hypothetical protein
MHYHGTDVFVTFLATFSGVLASFLLWILGEHFIKRNKDKNASKAVLVEVENEITQNIEILTTQENKLKEIIGSKSSPNFLIQLKNTASSYALSSGEVRALHDRGKERIIRDANALCDYFNDFAKSMDTFAAIQSLSRLRQPFEERLIDFVRITQDTKSLFKDYQDKLQQETLSNVDRHEILSSPVKEPGKKETQSDRIEKGIAIVTDQLNDIKKTGSAQFIASVGIACVSIAIAFWAASISDNTKGYANTATFILFGGLIILATANWHYTKVKNCLGNLGIACAIIGVILLFVMSFMSSSSTWLLYPGLFLSTIGLLIISLAAYRVSRHEGSGTRK